MTDNIIKDTLLKYFPAIDEETIGKYIKMADLYREWNAKINVISRTDIDNVFEHHILHSLSLAAFLGPLKEGTRIFDLGTGGGFPGIPLAVFYPHCQFHLIDRIGKKIRVANEIADSIGLANVTFQHGDSGECHERFDYVVSRAVMALGALASIAMRNVASCKGKGYANRYSPGIVCLKGGDLADEIEAANRAVFDVPVSDFFSEPFFKTKSIVYVPKC